MGRRRADRGSLTVPWRGPCAGALASWLVLGSPVVARADGPPPQESDAERAGSLPAVPSWSGSRRSPGLEPPRLVRFGLRGGLAVGVGSAGGGLGLSAEVDLWLGSVVGLGARGAGAYATLMLDDESSLVSASPMVLVRAGSAQTYVRIGLGFGIGRAVYREHAYCVSLGESHECEPPIAHERSAPVLTVDGALLWHSSGLELGPTLSFDTAGGDVYLLAGFAVGGAVSEGRRALARR